MSETTALRWAFIVYAALGIVVFTRYRLLSPAVERVGAPPARALGESRRIVYRLAALFSLDAFGGGFVITALLVLWLQRRFDLSIAVAGAVFFWAGVLSAFSALVAVRIARRIGLVRTMVFTHLPANGLLILAAFMPTAGTAVACLLARAALSQMDVPARTSYVMAVVQPAERPAAASVTNVPRSLAAAIPPVSPGGCSANRPPAWPRVDASAAINVGMAADHRRQIKAVVRPTQAAGSAPPSPTPKRPASAPPVVSSLVRRPRRR